MNKDKCICGSGDVREIMHIEEGDRSILRCKKCRLGWTYPPPGVDYKKYDFSDYYKYKKVHQSRPEKLVAILKRFKDTGRLLELGCGPGFLLELAKKSGFEIKGIEISDDAVKNARRLLGEPVVVKEDAAGCNFAGGEYDIVVMDNFLEHVANPKELLVKVKNILRDDGLILICSPDIDGLYVRLLKGRSYVLRPAEHIWQFSVKGIRNLLDEAGYFPIRIKRIGFINEELWAHNLRFFTFSSVGIRDLFLNSLNYVLGKLGFGDMFIAVAKKA